MCFAPLERKGNHSTSLHVYSPTTTGLEASARQAAGCHGRCIAILNTPRKATDTQTRARTVYIGCVRALSSHRPLAQT